MLRRLVELVTPWWRWWRSDLPDPVADLIYDQFRIEEVP